MTEAISDVLSAHREELRTLIAERERLRAREAELREQLAAEEHGLGDVRAEVQRARTENERCGLVRAELRAELGEDPSSSSAN